MSFQLTTQDYPRYTYNDYKHWEGDWELIRGIPYAMAPSPAWQHQSFGSSFIYLIKSALRTGTQCNCEVLYETDWIISDDIVVRPDVMIVCEPIAGVHITIPPSLILEILSPSTVLKDRNTKFNLYQAYGVRYYLLADVGKQQLEVFELINNAYQQLAQPIIIRLTETCRFTLNVSELFS